MKDLTEIQNLPINERLALVSAIWNSLIPEMEGSAISQDLREELDAELTAHRKNPESSRPWEEIERELFPEK